MKHLSDQRLVLLHYGELSREEERRVREHLRACEACRAADRRLRAVLAEVELPVPEPAGDYETTLWRRLEPQLGEPREVPWQPAWRPLGLAAATLLIVAAAAFVAVTRFGHERTRRQPAPESTTPLATGIERTLEDEAAAARERILLGAVDDHLARVERMLVEIANAAVDDAATLAAARVEAADLVEASRLYRLAASSAGDTTTAGMMDEIERALIEVARSPVGIPRREREAVVRLVDPDVLLFRLRTTAEHVRTRTRAAAEGGRVVSN